LNSPLIAEPLTRLMCSPIGDKAAAVLLCPQSIAARYTARPVRVLAFVLASGSEEGASVERAAHQAYKTAGLGSHDCGVIELHDACSPAELVLYEQLGLCRPGEGGKLVDDRTTELTGRIPVNPSGGLIARGHPVGATGVAQICEIFWQLRGEAGERQVANPKVGLTENAGGMIRNEPAAVSVHILGI
jgi:acetyl-CoA acetyltransferase